ncbi:hypothetical protein AAGS61_09485 [Lysinibacillus sp. KU-BSD001]|uniref:hypothetical protein n=1 Tax=Lysinibacillus sp. KU-BSD001 TaxID=3141328 RepID=UPI0036E35859
MSIVFIFMLVIGILIGWLISYLYRDREKVDKGFTLMYVKLSYRRKMIRILWMFPVVVFLLIIIFKYGEFDTTMNILVAMLLTILLIIQTVYNYYQWKKP